MSVYMSVCPSRCGIVSKRTKLVFDSFGFCQLRARRLWFLQISGSSQNSNGVTLSEGVWLNESALDPHPDPAGYPVNLVDPARSNVSGSRSCRIWGWSGKYWPDLRNYDIKHHSIFIPSNDAWQHGTVYDNSLTQSFQFNTVNVRH